MAFIYHVSDFWGGSLYGSVRFGAGTFSALQAATIAANVTATKATSAPLACSKCDQSQNYGRNKVRVVWLAKDRWTEIGGEHTAKTAPRDLVSWR